ncbi:Oidioi.mRNA.OKI2018_I69.PAR.g10241.t1.cds [Oikopleura dioica]|uniref:non-specific serine/threonine protein kinase n=1 Tax=Oikopleura dioica TaxID=34765 RepID=A0ABN7RQP3_OIKDI|nr:Oidioi.mRNA.OKI2018_I69.PAR.g10241.t1.cds [Oikopleura dioica]
MEAQNQQQQLLLQQYLQYQSLQQQQAAQLPQLPEDAMLRMNLLMMAQLQAQQELLNKQMMFSRVDQGYYTSSASSGSSPVRDLESPPPAPKKSRKRQKSKDESKSARKQQKSSSQEKQTFLGLYEVYGVIGVGGGGMVYSGRRITDGLPVAIKRVMREKVKRWETVDGHKVPQEIALMLRVYGHPGVIRLEDWYECMDSFILVMERPESAVDLFDYIRESGRMGESEAQDVFKQIVVAVAHIHSRGVVHRDIKDENIILERETGEIKLIDFGCGTMLKESAYRDFSGTPEFYPPEWFTSKYYHARTAAVWSLGILLYDMLLGEIPFKSKEKIIENQLHFKHSISDSALDLIRCLLQSDPEQRPPLEQILLHPWFQ